MTVRARRGFGLVGIILVVLLLTGVGLFISYLARQADRSGRWFQHSQMAFGLADAGIKQALYLLSQQNSKALASGPQPAGASLASVFDALTGGQIGTAVTLFSTANAADLPQGLLAQLEPINAEFSPTLDVTFEVLENGPFYDGLVEGVPLIEGERKGAIRITARASVKTPVGVRVERTITLEKGFRVISLLPPLLGRFGLFIDPRGQPDPNTFTARFDPNTGDAAPEAGNVPVILKSKFSAPIVTRGTATLDRAGFATAIADPKFLDKQGWVYLGAGEGNAEWTLKLTHGYGPTGETPLILGERVLVAFRGSDDEGFRLRFDDAFAKNALEGCQSDLEHEKTGVEGLEHFAHGWAANYEIIGLDPPSFGLVGGGNGNRTAMNFGSGISSALRPFGTTDALSPTLVFGPAYASMLRRASIHALVGPPEFCKISGLFRFNLFRLEEHVPQFQAVLTPAFAGAYAQWGTAVEEFPYVDALNVVLSGQGSGEYVPNGILKRTAAGGGAKAYASDYFPWVAGLGTQAGIPQAEIDGLMRGQMNQPKIFSGNLSTGLKAFQTVLARKTTYDIRIDAFESRLLGGPDKKQLSVPGIVSLKGAATGTATLTVPGGVTVARGGIIVNNGPIVVQGDIRRSGPGEPLTLVALNGDITVAAGAKDVQAYLVAANGKVDVQAPGCVISGGLACRELDFDRLRGLAAPLTIAHAEEVDPVGPLREQSLRVYYGGEDRIVAGGTGP